MSQVRISKRFFDDHQERDLPTPVVIKETARYYIIDSADPAFQDLLDDAMHYADANGPDDLPPGLKSSAKSVVAVASQYLSSVSILIKAAKSAAEVLKEYADDHENGSVRLGAYGAAKDARDIIIGAVKRVESR